MSNHTLKVQWEPYHALASGAKTSEVRRCDDRVFVVGQVVELKLISSTGEFTKEKLYRRISHIQQGFGLPEGLCVLSYHEMPNTLGGSTPAHIWEDGQDPHGDRYDCERAELALGQLTDDQLANAAFLGYDQPLNVNRILAKDPNYYPPIALMTAVKDRIRWLSRRLEEK